MASYNMGVFRLSCPGSVFNVNSISCRRNHSITSGDLVPIGVISAFDSPGLSAMASGVSIPDFVPNVGSVSTDCR